MDRPVAVYLRVVFRLVGEIHAVALMPQLVEHGQQQAVAGAHVQHLAAAAQPEGDIGKAIDAAGEYLILNRVRQVIQLAFPPPCKHAPEDFLPRKGMYHIVHRIRQSL